MQVKQFDKASRFLAETEAYLLQAECLNSLILGITYRLRDGYSGFAAIKDPLMLAVQIDDAVVGTAVRTPPHNLVVQSHLAQPEPAMRALAEALRAQALPGALGEINAVTEFAIIWEQLTGQTSRLEMHQGVYELRQVEPTSPVPGTFRPARPEEEALIFEWMQGFNRDAFGKANEEAAGRMTRNHLADGNFFIWDDDGPVSIVARTRASPNGRSVSLVYTPPELRGRGYATAVVAGLSRKLLDDGYHFCTLFTDMANPTSNSIYRKIGYHQIAEFVNFAFGDPPTP